MAAEFGRFAVRKANVLVYKRHEAELAPILDALLELVGEVRRPRQGNGGKDHG